MSPQRKKGKNRTRQLKAMQNLAKGMSVEKALTEAGYSASYAATGGYAAVKRPFMQSLFTDSCERIMAERNMKFDALVKPYFDALVAKMIVKSQQLGDAQEVDLPDHATRMTAAEKIIDLYGGTQVKSDKGDEPQRPITIIIQQYDTAQPQTIIDTKTDE